MNNYVITISREYASGGRLIGKEVAEKLGIEYYDKTVTELVSQQSGLSEQFIDNAETNARSSLLFGMSLASVAPLQDSVFLTQARTIRNLAEKGPCVFVGRCADYILHDYENLLSVFIYAPLLSRIKRAKELYGLTGGNIKSQVLKKDKARNVYHSLYSDNDWGDPHSYDLCLNSEIGIEAAARIIIAALNEKLSHKQ